MAKRMTREIGSTCALIAIGEALAGGAMLLDFRWVEGSAFLLCSLSTSWLALYCLTRIELRRR